MIKRIEAILGKHSLKRQIILMVSLLLLVGLGTYASLAALATTKARSYRQSVKTYAEQTVKTVDTNAEQIRQLKVEKSADLTGLATQLTNLETSLQTAINDVPRLGTIWFATDVSAEYRNQGGAELRLKSVYQSLLVRVQEINQFASYNTQVAAILETLTAKESLEVADLAGHEALFKTAADNLKKLTPPEKLTETQSKLVTALETGAPHWKTLSETHKKLDAAGYNAAKAALEAQYAEMRAQAEKYTSYADELAENLRTIVEALHQVQAEL